MRALQRCLVAFGLCAIMCDPAAAQWSASGVAVCIPPRTRSNVEMIGDGQGGAVVAWLDSRDAASVRDIYAHHVFAGGTVDPAWPPLGLPVCVAAGTQDVLRIVGDGLGGAYVAWRDKRLGTRLVFLQRVLAGGTIAPGWPVNGLQVSATPMPVDRDFDLAPDGAGGAYLVWHTLALQLLAQRIGPDGSPATGWPDTGVVVLGNWRRNLPRVEPAPTGGCYVLFNNVVDNTGGGWVMRLDPTGQPEAGWPLVGRMVIQNSSTLSDPSDLVLDSAGDLFMAFDSFPAEGELQVVQRASPDATPLWGISGMGADTHSDPNMDDIHLLPDGAGGAFMTFEVIPVFGGSSYDVLVNRLDAAGSEAPGWPGAVLACDTTGFQGLPRLAADGAGGVYVAYSTRLSAWTFDRMFVQHLDGSGQRYPGWPATGVHVCDSDSGQIWPAIVSDDRGGALVAWADTRVYPSQGVGIFVQRLLPDGQPAVVGVGSDQPRAAAALSVRPNPSSGELELTLEFPRAGRAALDVLDASGRCVASRDLEDQPAGRREVEWRMPASLPAGLYWVRARWPGGTVARRIALVR